MTPTLLLTYNSAGLVASITDAQQHTTSFTYDGRGNRLTSTDALQQTTTYDYVHRLTAVSYPKGPYGGATPTKQFVYDSATVNGILLSKTAGRLAEAYTCGTTCATKATDLGFSYSARGDVLNVLESTPNSGGYYNVGATYWANGLTNTLSGVGVPTITYGPDGEGRVNTVSASSGQNPVSSTTYNLGPGLPTNVVLGSGDSDAFGYDAMGRMSSYQFNIGSNAVARQLTGNPNGTLQQLAITDPFISSDQQTCNYTYDDLARLHTAGCGSVWSQTFSPDPFGNLSKSGTVTFQPTYNTATNRTSSIGSYDANGNLTSDSIATYAWNAEGRPTSVTNTYGNVSLTFDALNRLVEELNGSTYYQIVYGPTGGKLELMTGQTLSTAYVPLPAGDTAVYYSTGLRHYRRADWLGSARFTSGTSQNLAHDGAYAPYGETYAEAGTADHNFAEMEQWVMGSGPYPLYDGMYREYHPTWSRWISPDPAGLSAANPGNPQTWNRYAYVSNNPLGLSDPSGLGLCPPNFSSLGSGACVSNYTNGQLLGDLAEWQDPFDQFGDWAYYEGPVWVPDLPDKVVDSIAELPLNLRLPFDLFRKLLPGCLQVTGQSIDSAMKKIDPSSPLIGQGDNLVNSGVSNGVDPRFLVALAGAESSLGTLVNRKWGLHNPFGWSTGPS